MGPVVRRAAATGVSDFVRSGCCANAAPSPAVHIPTTITTTAPTIHSSREVRLASLEHPNLGLLTSAMRNSKVEPVLVHHKQRRPRAGGCRHVTDPGESIAALILDHVDVSFTTAHIQPFPRGVVEHIVRVADDLERADFLASGRVEYQGFCWPPASDEDAMVRLVERHGEIRLRRLDRPRGDDFHRTAIDDSDVIGRRHIDKYP